MAGTTSVTFTLTDAAGATATTALSIVINVVPTITTASPLPVGGEDAGVLHDARGHRRHDRVRVDGDGHADRGHARVDDRDHVGHADGDCGTFTVAVTLTDASGAVATASLTLVVNAQPAVTSVVLANAATGGTVGRVGPGDTITVVFSAQMKVSDLVLDVDDGDTTNQGLSADSDVGVIAHRCDERHDHRHERDVHVQLRFDRPRVARLHQRYRGEVQRHEHQQVDDRVERDHPHAPHHARRPGLGHGTHDRRVKPVRSTRRRRRSATRPAPHSRPTTFTLATAQQF